MEYDVFITTNSYGIKKFKCEIRNKKLVWFFFPTLMGENKKYRECEDFAISF